MTPEMACIKELQEIVSDLSSALGSVERRVAVLETRGSNVVRLPARLVRDLDEGPEAA